MKDSKTMTLLYKGRTEKDITEMLKDKGVEYRALHCVNKVDSVVLYTTDKSYVVAFHNGICFNVKTE